MSASNEPHLSLSDVLGSLRSGSPAGLHEVAHPLDGVARLSRALGWDTWSIEVGKVSDKAEFMDAIADAANLPEWFGKNWDALADVLGDRSPQGRGHVWIVRNPSTLSSTDPATASAFRSVLADAAQEWSERGIDTLTFWETAPTPT